jgi:hypothetical protein
MGGVVTALLALAALQGCALLGSSRDDEIQQELNRNRRQWQAQGLDDYRYEVRRGCFCPAEVVGPVVVEVRDGEVVQRIYAENGEPVGATYAGLWTDVDGVFDVIQDAIDRDAARITAEYHPEMGYPRSIAIDYLAQAVDEEIAVTVGEVEPLP